MENINKIIGSRVRKLRKDAGIYQAEIGTHLGIGKGQVSKYESGDGRFTAEMLIILAKIFNVSLDYLLTGATPPISPVHSDPHINEMAGEYKGNLSILKPLDRRAEQLVGAYQYLCEHNEELAQRLYEDAIEALLIAKLK